MFNRNDAKSVIVYALISILINNLRNVVISSKTATRGIRLLPCLLAYLPISKVKTDPPIASSPPTIPGVARVPIMRNT